MSNEKTRITLLTVVLIKKVSLYKMSQYFPKPHEGSGNYATKGDLKGATDVDTSNEATKSNLAGLKS